MQFIDIRKELKDVLFEEIRQDNDGYFEAVVIQTESAKLTSALNKTLGSATQPTPKAEKILKEFGGIKQGQSLYFKDEGKEKFIAMLWPWQDGEHTTVKIIRKT